MYITYPMITMLKAVSTLSLEARFNILTSVMFKTDLQDKTELYFAKCYKEEFDKANKGHAKANARIITPGMIRMLKNEKLSILQRYNILVSVMFGSPIHEYGIAPIIRRLGPRYRQVNRDRLAAICNGAAQDRR